MSLYAYTEQCSHVVCVLNKCHPITWGLCVKYYCVILKPPPRLGKMLDQHLLSITNPFMV